VDPITKEAAKMALMIFFTLLNQAGKSPEQMAEMYKSERDEFFTKKAKDLPDV